jgi:hypothetical protein
LGLDHRPRGSIPQNGPRRCRDQACYLSAPRILGWSGSGTQQRSGKPSAWTALAPITTGLPGRAWGRIRSQAVGNWICRFFRRASQHLRIPVDSVSLSMASVSTHFRFGGPGIRAFMSVSVFWGIENNCTCIVNLR